jgi:hypothetical protein
LQLLLDSSYKTFLIMPKLTQPGNVEYSMPQTTTQQNGLTLGPNAVSKLAPPTVVIAPVASQTPTATKA